MAPAAARTMLCIMRGVTENGGTAKQAAIEGYAVGGQDRHGAEGRQRPLRSHEVGVVVRRRRARRGPAAGRSWSSWTSRRAGTSAARSRRRSSRRSPSRRCATCTCRRPRRSSRRRGREGCRRQGGGEGRGRAADGAGRRGRGGGEAPATDLPLDDDALGDDPRAGGEMGRGRRRRGRPGGAARRPSGSIVPDFVGHEPRPGDPRRAQERRRAGLRRSGGTRDRRGAAPAARARPGTAGCGLPRGVRAQGMNAPGVHARGPAGGHRRRARARRRARRAWPRCATIRGRWSRGDLFVAVPGTVVDGAPVPAPTRSGGARAALVVEGEPPAELRRSPGAVVVVPNARHALGVIARNRFRRRRGARRCPR